MNIFIMVLVFLFMAGYYFMDSPSNRVTRSELDNAVIQSDMRSIAECATMLHTAKIKETSFEDICLNQYQVASRRICMNDRQSIVNCEVARGKKPEFSFIITTTAPLGEGDYNNMLEILEKYYPDAGTFGVFMGDIILTGGPSGKRGVPKSIIAALKLTDGQLVYMTQYEIPDAPSEFATPGATDIKCPVGTAKLFRFNRWQCVDENKKTNCAGARIWDSDAGECVPDNSRRPLCGANQTAVMVDDAWECIDPFSEKTCPDNMIARLNYNNLEWECVEDPNKAVAPSKCAPGGRALIRGGVGGTLRVSMNFCTACEEMVIDPDTCASYCIPSAAKLTDQKCYPAAATTCSGSKRAFYFGFPNAAYASRTSVAAGTTIPFDISHSQNRKFNCLDCGAGDIDSDRSKPPFVAVCK